MKLLVFAILLLASFMACSQDIVVAPFSRCKEPDRIYFVIKNIGDAEVSILEKDLPWKFTSGLIFYQAFKRVNSTLEGIDRGSIIYDNFTRPKRVSLAPGEQRYGAIYLDRLIENFPNESKISDLFLFYRINRQGYLPLNGFIFIPRKRLFNISCPLVVRDGRGVK